MGLLLRQCWLARVTLCYSWLIERVVQISDIAVIFEVMKLAFAEVYTNWYFRMLSLCRVYFWKVFLPLLFEPTPSTAVAESSVPYVRVRFGRNQFIFMKKCHMSSCEWFKMMWTLNNLMWKFNFGSLVPNLTLTYLT